MAQSKTTSLRLWVTMIRARRVGESALDNRELVIRGSFVWHAPSQCGDRGGRHTRYNGPPNEESSTPAGRDDWQRPKLPYCVPAEGPSGDIGSEKCCPWS